MVRRVKSWATFVGVGLVVLPIIVVGGCNGGSNGGGVNNPTPTPTLSTAQYAGTYSGTFSGQASGTVNFTVSSTGAVTGTLNTTNAASVATRATYTATGSIDSSGNLSISFTVGAQTYTFGGQFVRSGNTISFINGKWTSSSGKSGTFALGSVTITPTATPIVTGTPGAGATSTPTGGATATPIPTGSADCGTGSASATFSSASGTNADTSKLTGSQFSGEYRTQSGAGKQLGFNFSNGCNPVTVARSIAVTMSALTSNLTPGNTYPAATPTNGVPSVVSNIAYTETNVSTKVSHIWIAQSGSIRIDSISGTTLKFTILNARFAAAEGSTSTTGSFTINASGQITIRRTGN